MTLHPDGSTTATSPDDRSGVCTVQLAYADH